MALGRKWFGKIQVALFGKDQWEAQDASQVWSDGGAIKQLLDETTRSLEKIVAENAILSVSDFASTGSAALRAEEGGEVIVGVRLESGQAHQILEIPLRALFTASLMDARKRLGVDPEAQDVVSSLLTICQQIVAALQPTRERPAGLGPNPGSVLGQPMTHQQAAAKTTRPPGRVSPTEHPNFPGPVMG